MQKLPLSTSTFKEIIEGGQVYVDKTRFLHEIATNGKAFFLSRPRRFGKSLLVSTLEELFRGNKKLFAGLDITRADPKFVFKKHPIMSLDMSQRNAKSPELLERSIVRKLGEVAKSEGVKLKLEFPGDTLEALIQNLARKYKERLVVLIDEYDSPVSETLGKLGPPGSNQTLAEANAEVLKSFYGAFKGVDKHLRFVFVTGVTRYAFMGLSAGFNQLQDISLVPEFSAICGFTREELERYFGDRFESTLQRMKENKRARPEKPGPQGLVEDIIARYDGYSWGGETRVLNPVSVVKFFYEAVFKDYWLGTARGPGPSSRILEEAMAEDPLGFTGDKLRDIPDEEVEWVEVGSLKPVPAMFQTGYLTVDKVVQDSVESNLSYYFRVPNMEVGKKFFKIMAMNIRKVLETDFMAESKEFLAALRGGDAEKLSELMTRACRSLSSAIHPRYPDMRLNEAFYDGMFFMYCFLLAKDVRSEPPGAGGTPDMTFLFPGRLRAVVELKYAPDPVDEADEAQKRAEEEAKKRGEQGAEETGSTAGAPPEAPKKRVAKPKSREKLERERSKLLDKLTGKAIKQILRKGYHVPYGGRGEKVVLVGAGVCGRGWCRFRLEDPPLPIVPSR